MIDATPDEGLQPQGIEAEAVAETLEQHGLDADGSSTATPAAAELAEPMADALTEKLFDPNWDSEPAWYQAIARTHGGKAVQLTDEQIANLPIEAQEALYNVRLAALAGNQAATAAQAELATNKAALEMAGRSLDRERAELQTLAGPLREYINQIKPKGEAPDPASQAGQEWAAQEQVHQYLDGFVRQIEKAEGAKVQRIRDAEAAHARAEKEAGMQAYVREHWDDFQNPVVFQQVQDIVDRSAKANPDGTREWGITPMEAHQLVMGRLAADNNAEAVAYAKERARALLRRSGQGEPVIPVTPQDLTHEARLKWYRQNPGAYERDLSEAEKYDTSLG